MYDFGRELRRILIDKYKIMSNQKDSKEAETKPELYTLLCAGAEFKSQNFLFSRTLFLFFLRDGKIFLVFL